MHLILPLLFLLPLLTECQHPLVYDYTDQEMEQFIREVVRMMHICQGPDLLSLTRMR